jgi:hypothetical protein
MMVTWLAPAAWAGLALLALPVLVHLLARQRSERVPFPSLRFVPASQLAALRRRAISNWPLLVVRLLIVLAAVAAAAAPVVVSRQRQRAWDERVARAVVITGDASRVRAIEEEAVQSAFRAATFSAAHPADALREAAEWLTQQPPAAREVVIIGDLPEGSLAARDFDVLPPHVGIRFLPGSPSEPASGVELEGSAEGADGAVSRYRLTVTPTMTQTRATYTPDSRARVPPLSIVAAPAEQPRADALLRAVLLDGVVADAQQERAVRIVFTGAVAAPSALTSEANQARPRSDDHASWIREVLTKIPEMRGELAGSELIVRVPMRVVDDRAPSAVARIVSLTYGDSYDRREPRQLSPAALAAWSRPAGGSPPDAHPADEGDRRWLWGLALLLIGVEGLMRRGERRD